MRLHKLFIFILALSFLLVSAAYGIDKETDKKQERKKVDTLMKKPEAPNQKNVKGKPAQTGSTGGRDYNDFIDKNNNGIDDRAEYRKKASSQDTDNSQTQKQKADSTKTKKK